MNSAGKYETRPMTHCNAIVLLIGKPARLTINKTSRFAKEPMGSILPASPASTASLGPIWVEIFVTLKINCVAGTLLIMLDSTPTKMPEYGC